MDVFEDLAHSIHNELVKLLHTTALEQLSQELEYFLFSTLHDTLSLSQLVHKSHSLGIFLRPRTMSFATLHTLELLLASLSMHSSVFVSHLLRASHACLISFAGLGLMSQALAAGH